MDEKSSPEPAVVEIKGSNNALKLDPVIKSSSEFSSNDYVSLDSITVHELASVTMESATESSRTMTGEGSHAANDTATTRSHVLSPTCAQSDATAMSITNSTAEQSERDEQRNAKCNEGESDANHLAKSTTTNPNGETLDLDTEEQQFFLTSSSTTALSPRRAEKELSPRSELALKRRSKPAEEAAKRHSKKFHAHEIHAHVQREAEKELEGDEVPGEHGARRHKRRSRRLSASLQPESGTSENENGEASELTSSVEVVRRQGAETEESEREREAVAEDGTEDEKSVTTNSTSTGKDIEILPISQRIPRITPPVRTVTHGGSAAKHTLTKKGSRDDMSIHREITKDTKEPGTTSGPSKQPVRNRRNSETVALSEKASNSTTNSSSSGWGSKNFGSMRALVGKRKKDVVHSQLFTDPNKLRPLEIVCEDKLFQFQTYNSQLSVLEFVNSNVMKVIGSEAVKNRKGELVEWKTRLSALPDTLLFILSHDAVENTGTAEYIFQLGGGLCARSQIFRKRVDEDLKITDNFLNGEEFKSAFKRRVAVEKKKKEKKEKETKPHNNFMKSSNAGIPVTDKKGSAFFDFLSKSYTQSQLVVEPDDQGIWRVMAGTLEVLVEVLTHAQGRDKAFESDFILSFDSMLTPYNLFERITQRYQEGSVEVKQHVLEIYKLWISRRKYCFEDQQLKEDFLKWFTDIKNDDLKKENYLDKRLVMGFTLYIESEVCSSMRSIEMAKIEKELLEEDALCGPDPLLFPHDRDRALAPDLLDFHPFEFARQLTILDSLSLRKVKAHEWIGKGLSSGKSVNLLSFIARFNLFSAWVATLVCLGPTIEIRCLCIKFFLSCALGLASLNNFNSAMAIVSGLSMGPVVRLLQTWHALGHQAAKWFELIKELMGMEKNFKKLRAYEDASEHCIPYLGMYTKDLIFIEDGNPDTTETDLVNFEKRHMVASVIDKMEHFANLRYSLAPVSEIQDYLTDALWCISEDDMWIESFQRESKEMNAKLKEKNAKRGIY